MEVVNVLHMNGGDGVESYANNSSLQKKALLMTEPILEEAIVELYRKLHYPKSLSVADLGCSSGPNTLLFASHFVRTIQKTCEREGKDSPEVQIYLNDLPSNDFNTIFKSLPSFHESLRKEMIMEYSSISLFFNGVPGSFYRRLFLANSLHFIHSSYSLHWLSQVPNDVESNKGNICVSSTSPPNVLTSYCEQFRQDFSTFLRLRWVELARGGRMVLTIMGRKSEDPRSKESCYTLELLAKVLNQMVMEGTIEEKELHSLNIPVYSPSPEEVKSIVEEEGLFRIDYLETLEINWCGCDIDDHHHHHNNNVSRNNERCGYNVAKTIRAVVEPILISHFGKAIIMDELFGRYQDIVTHSMSMEKTTYANITISITKI